MKLRIQAQHLQPGDIVVGSGEKVLDTIINTVNLPSNKIWVKLETKDSFRCVQWGKYTMINIQREG